MTLIIVDLNQAFACALINYVESFQNEQPVLKLNTYCIQVYLYSQWLKLKVERY